MMPGGHRSYGRAPLLACAVLLALAFAQPSHADSYAGLNMFGFPAIRADSTGLSGIMADGGTISASAESVSPSNQYTAWFGSGISGIQLGVGFGYPEASHDASTVQFARNVAYEASLGNDAIAFPDVNASFASLSDFPSIESDNSDVKYMESVQLALSTESDTMPVAGFSYPASFSGFFG